MVQIWIWIVIFGNTYSNIRCNTVKELTSEERNCLFSLEGNLEFYEMYSYDNCVLECKIKITEKKLNCTPWFLPHRSLLGENYPADVVDVLFSVQNMEKSAIPGSDENSWSSLTRLHQECLLFNYKPVPRSYPTSVWRLQVTDNDDVHSSFALWI